MTAIGRTRISIVTTDRVSPEALPATQASFCVQLLPSLQVLPSDRLTDSYAVARITNLFRAVVDVSRWSVTGHHGGRVVLTGVGLANGPVHITEDGTIAGHPVGNRNRSGTCQNVQILPRRRLRYRRLPPCRPDRRHRTPYCWCRYSRRRGLQVSSVHALSSSQSNVPPPTHTPSVLQASPVVHSFPSSQSTPVNGSDTHPLAASHESLAVVSIVTGHSGATCATAVGTDIVLCTSISIITGGVVWRERTAPGIFITGIICTRIFRRCIPGSHQGCRLRYCRCRQRYRMAPSSQGPSAGIDVQPVSASHESAVQILSSSQSTASPGRQFPPEQRSFSVQASPSSQTP